MYNYYVEFQERMIIVRKRIIALLVLIVTAFTLCGSVYAEENAVKTYTLSLDDAIKMMIERDPSFKSADVKLCEIRPVSCDHGIARNKLNCIDLCSVYSDAYL